MIKKILFPIILSFLTYNIYYGKYSDLYNLIPTELRGWILMSILGPITSTILSTSSWFSMFQNCFVYSHSWNKQIDGDNSIEWISVYLMKNKIYSYDSLTKIITSRTSFWWDDNSKTYNRPQIYDIPLGWILTKYKSNYVLVYYPTPTLITNTVNFDKTNHIITVYSLKKINWSEFLSVMRDEYYNTIESSKMTVYKNSKSYIGHDIMSIIPTRKNASIDMCFGNKNKEKVWGSVMAFLNPKIKEDYKKLNQTYKTAYLIYGPPGTGKSELLYQIASFTWKEHQKPIYIINPKGLDDYDLDELFEQIQSGYVLVDEWDMHLEEKGSFEKDNKYPSLNAWLNLLDRVEGEIIFWFTSNNYEKIQAFNDGALIRPGRIDNVIKFEKMTTEEVFSAWEYFKPNDPDIKIVKELNLNFDGVTIAQIINTLKQYLPLSVLAQTSQPS